MGNTLIGFIQESRSPIRIYYIIISMYYINFYVLLCWKKETWILNELGHGRERKIPDLMFPLGTLRMYYKMALLPAWEILYPMVHIVCITWPSLNFHPLCSFLFLYLYKHQVNLIPKYSTRDCWLQKSNIEYQIFIIWIISLVLFPLGVTYSAIRDSNK